MMTNPRQAHHARPVLVPARPHRRADHRADRVLRSSNGWAVSVEYTDDPHPRNTYWEMCGTADVRSEGRRRGAAWRSTSAARRIPNHYIRRDRVRFRRAASETRAHVVHREPARRTSPASAERQEVAGRSIRYTIAQLRRRPSPKASATS